MNAMSNPFETLENRLGQIEQLLRQLSINLSNTAPSQTKDILNTEEAAEFLNLKVPSIYGLVQRRDIPFSKRGKLLYFSRKELEQWVKEGRQKTVQEIKSETYLKIRGRGEKA
jgi:excisionase family DNA binding protein